MLFKSIATAACLAVASHAASDVAVPIHMSVRQVFGLVHARDDIGYSPTQAFCAMGLTCAEACGAGFQMCPSNDNSIHCYNPTAKASCCPGGGGVSCDDGFYCANNAKGEQLCCPNGKPLSECAGAVASVAALPPTTSTSSSSSTTSASTSSSSSVVSVNSTITSTTSAYSVQSSPSGGFSVSANSTATTTVMATSTRGPGGFTSSAPTPTQLPPTGAGSIAGPSALLLGLTALAFAALL